MSDAGQGGQEAEAWRPSLGAWVEAAGVRFRVWAPERRRVEVVVEGDEAASVSLDRDAHGYW